MMVHYRNEMTRNYLVIMGKEEHYASPYQLKMMTGNQVEGLLKVNCRQVDGCNEYYYDITGKQALLQYLGQHDLNVGEITRIILQIHAVIENLEKFLLDFHQLVLEPECIFLDHAGTKLFFCYRLDEQLSFSKSFLALSEMMIKEVDHQDQAAAKLAYAVYQTAVQQDFDLEELLELLRENREEHAEASGEEEEKKPAEETGTYEEKDEPKPAEQKNSVAPKKIHLIFWITGIIWCAAAWELLFGAGKNFQRYFPWFLAGTGVLIFAALLKYAGIRKGMGVKEVRAEEVPEKIKEPERTAELSGKKEIRTEENENHAVQEGIEMAISPEKNAVQFFTDRTRYQLVSMTNGTDELVVAIYRKTKEEEKIETDLTESGLSDKV